MDEDDDYPSFLTVGMLDKNEGSFMAHIDLDP